MVFFPDSLWWLRLREWYYRRALETVKRRIYHNMAVAMSPGTPDYFKPVINAKILDDQREREYLEKILNRIRLKLVIFERY